MKTKQYDHYSPAPVAWLGEVPADWAVKRVKDVADTTSGTTPTSGNRLYYEEGTHNWVRTTDLNNAVLNDCVYKVTDLALRECRLAFLPANSVLVAMYGGFGTIGKNAVLGQPATINQSVCAILPNARKFNSRYLQYFLQHFRSAWRLFALGSRKDPNINQDAVKNLFIIQPSLLEQDAIVDYLDRHTRAFDLTIVGLEAKMGIYEELRKTLITEVVCRGLNPDAPRQESGVAWLGVVPAHWEVKRVKDVADCRFSNVDKKEVEGEAPVLLCNYVDVYKNDRITAELSFMQATASKEAVKRFGLRRGDVLITKDSETALDIAVPALVTERLTNVVCGYHLALIRPQASQIEPSYLFYLFSSRKFNYGFAIAATGITRVGLSINALTDAPVLLPPPAEQQAIAAHLDAKTATIDRILATLTTQITTLRELRRTLISDVVTGRVKVTT